MAIAGSTASVGSGTSSFRTIELRGATYRQASSTRAEALRDAGRRPGDEHGHAQVVGREVDDARQEHEERGARAPGDSSGFRAKTKPH